jgi:hypothetical protein
LKTEILNGGGNEMTTVNFLGRAEAASATLSTAKISGFTPDGSKDKDTQLRFKLFVGLGGGFVQTMDEPA